MLCCLKERDHTADLSCRHRVAELIHSIVMVLRASHTLLPAAGWYAAKVFSASSRAKKLMVLNFFNLRALVICSCHLSLSQPFAPFLKLICFTNPFLHSLSGSFWTAFTDFNLFLAFVCFDFYYTFLFLATCARLS